MNIVSSLRSPFLRLKFVVRIIPLIFRWAANPNIVNILKKKRRRMAERLWNTIVIGKRQHINVGVITVQISSIVMNVVAAKMSAPISGNRISRSRRAERYDYTNSILI